MIDLDMIYLRKLMINGFDHLAHTIQEGVLFSRHLFFLVPVRQGHQTNAIVSKKLGSLVSTNVSLVTQNAEISMFAKHFEAHIQIVDVSGSQLKIDNNSTQGNEQVQLETKNRLFLEGTLPKVASKTRQSPVEPGTRYN